MLNIYINEENRLLFIVTNITEREDIIKDSALA